MKTFIPFVAALVAGLSLLGWVENASAAAKGKTYCPNVQFVCRSCKATPNPPSSSTNPQDTCCSFVIVGWRVCTDK